MRFEIEYHSEGFPTAPLSPVANGRATLSATWDELLWAALTVGRPNRQFVFRHGDDSVYEAIFRMSLVRMALEQQGVRIFHLRRTDAARTLDPSEKGAVNYFLGLAFGKLFAAKLLNTPWLLHLDVFRPQLNAALTGRSRPDLIGQADDGSWTVLECKGRLAPPSDDVIAKAKGQAQRVANINGATPSYCIGAITYFKKDVVHFYWEDPEPESNNDGSAIPITTEDQHWRHYYAPILALLRVHEDRLERMRSKPVLLPIESVDIKVGIHPEVLNLLLRSQWGEARAVASRLEIHSDLPMYQKDGIAVAAGDTWQKPFQENFEGRES